MRKSSATSQQIISAAFYYKINNMKGFVVFLLYLLPTYVHAGCTDDSPHIFKGVSGNFSDMVNPKVLQQGTWGSWRGLYEPNEECGFIIAVCSIIAALITNNQPDAIKLNPSLSFTLSIESFHLGKECQLELYAGNTTKGAPIRTITDTTTIVLNTATPGPNNIANVKVLGYFNTDGIPSLSIQLV